MAYIGLRHPVMAKITAETYGSAITYAAGMVIAKAIGANITWNRPDNPLYADDAISENDNGVTGGSVELNVDDLADEARAYALGLEKVGSTDAYSLTDKAAPYVGFGYIRVRRKSGVTSYQGFWYHKAQFGENSENAATKGESIEWGTPTLNGTIMGVVTDNTGVVRFREQQMFETEAAAIAWLEGKANISGT